MTQTYWTPPVADLRPLQRLLLLWWVATMLSARLEEALESGEVVVWDDVAGRRSTTAEQLAIMAEEAMAQIEKLEACLSS